MIRASGNAFFPQQIKLSIALFICNNDLTSVEYGYVYEGAIQVFTTLYSILNYRSLVAVIRRPSLFSPW